MSSTIRVRGGTLVEGESLCRTCRHAHIARGYRQNEVMVYCGWDTMRPVKFKVAECTDYLDKTVPTHFEIEKMAYIIHVEPARKRSGFVHPVGFLAEESVDDDE